MKQKRRKTAGAFGLAIVFVTAVATFFSTPASAQTDRACSPAVVDTSGTVDVEELEQLAAEVQSETTADLVLVRVYGGLETGELSTETAALQAACGTRNWVAVAVSLDGRERELFAPLTDASLDQIGTNIMAPNFRAGDFTGGVAESLQAIATELQSTTASVDTDSPTETDTVPVDNGDFPVDLVAAGAGLSAFAAAVGGGVLVARRRDLLDQRARFEAKRDEYQLRTGSASERFELLKKQANVWERTSGGQTAQELTRSMKEAASANNQVSHQAALVRQATPKGVGKANRQQLQADEGRLPQLEEALQNHKRQVDRVYKLGARIDHLRVALPAKQQLLDDELVSATTYAAELANDSWDVSSEADVLGQVQSNLAELDLTDLVLDVLTLHDKQEQAEATLFAARHRLQALPDRKVALEKWREQIEASYESEKRRIENSRQRFITTIEPHHPVSWEWATEHPDKANNRLESMIEDLHRIDLDGTSSADFDAVGQSLESVGLELLLADDLMDQLDDLLVDLDRARIESPSIVGQAEKILAALRDFVDAHASDLDDELRAAPGRMKPILDQLAAELTYHRPNYLHVAQTGDRINRDMDELVLRGEDQRLEAEALRRKIEREVVRAQRCLQRAQASLGWQLVRTADHTAIAALEAQLDNMPTELDARLDAARSISNAAVALQERIIARRRRNADWVIVSGGGGWSSGGWSSGGGWSGDSGGGSFGGGAGGGGSFGGFSGGGSFGGGHSSGGW